jgi:transcriptional regulator NrdR family protein
MTEIGDTYNKECPYCGHKEIKFWGSGPIGSEKNPYDVIESVCSCKKCNNSFCTINGRFSQLDGNVR